MPDMQREMEEAKRDFLFGELACLVLSGEFGPAEVRFESDDDKRSLIIYLSRRSPVPLRPLSLRPPRR
jgi:hypothetical protein